MPLSHSPASIHPTSLPRAGIISLCLCLILSSAMLISCETRSDAQSPTTPAKPNSVTFSIGSYNLYNLFDEFDDPYTRDETTAAQQPRRTAVIAEHILAVNSDFLAISETENEGILIRLNRHDLQNIPHDQPVAPLREPDQRYPLDGPATQSHLAKQPPILYPDRYGYYPYTYVSRREAGRNINCGFLSRIPVDSVTVYRWDTLSLPDETMTWPFSRPVVRATLTPASDIRIHVFAIHFKSKHDSANDLRSTKWRLAEAVGLRQKIATLRRDDPESYIAVVGDFNDVRDSRTLQVLLAEGDDDAQLVDLFKDYPEEKRWTYIPKRFRSQIDFVLADPRLARHLVPDSPLIYNPDDRVVASDHAPIKVTFTIPTADRQIPWQD